MATIHPSRMGLVPQDPKDVYCDRIRGRSPSYEDYKRPATPPSTDARNMYPNRHQRDRPPRAGGSYGGGGSEYLESRRAQREASTLSIWPASPKAPARTFSPSRDSKSRRQSKRDRSETPTDSSDSEEERRRRERKQRKRARKEKDRAERREKKTRASSRRRSYDSEEDDRERNRRSNSKSRARSPSPSRTPSPLPAGASEDEEDSDEDVGPQPLYKIIAKKFDERAYGSALLRGEGSAMAAFLQDDTDTRIPRRGEIGLTSDEIAQFESVGYVMSGSRHKRMNAVRMRKENQVISAEEKRGILKLQKDERQRREAILREEFSELVKDQLKGPQPQPK